MFLFLLLVILNRQPEVTEKLTVARADEAAAELFNGVHKENSQSETIYIKRGLTEVAGDRSGGVVLEQERDILVSRRGHVGVVANADHVVIGNRDNNLIVDGHIDVIEGNLNDKRSVGGALEGGDGRANVRHVPSHGDGTPTLDSRNRPISDGVVDLGLLEKAIKESKEKSLRDEDEVGNLTLAKDKNIAFDLIKTEPGEEGAQKGDLYAYDFPSQGVGAGIGAPAIGAGVGSAGIGAGIGEAVLDGEAVPTLGGVGTYSGRPQGGPALSLPTMGGVGGLVSGAGAGGAAGLTTSTVKEKVGLGTEGGSAKGCPLHGEGCGGHHGEGGGGDYDFSHLPRDGALHIMMHVDGSGSILHTRKQLELMKESLLKEALLPYYNNDEELYNRRVSIVDSSGERTLQFFQQAANKDSVLAVAFQDEAQPSYHMPNFNRKPEEHYLQDLNALKSSLGGHSGLYRGIMFQVDRGRTYAKSFKEFVENAWQGSGYLEGHNLKKYYWEENRHHIDNKDGIIFSDVYHTKDEGNPQYYLDLIFEASKRVGLDLNIYGAGLKDGKYTRED